MSWRPFEETNPAGRQDAISHFDAVFGKIDFTNEREVIRCSGDDLSSHITQNIREKIVNGQFINLGFLIKRHDITESYYQTSIFVNDQGILETHQKTPIKFIAYLFSMLLWYTCITKLCSLPVLLLYV